jgi:hypothetical protein
MFKKWLKVTTFPEDVMECVNEGNIQGTTVARYCDAAVPPAFRNCVEAAAEKALKQLQAQFSSDPYVKCRYNIGCICVGISEDCNVDYPCANCNRIKADELCIGKVTSGDYRGTKNLVKKKGEPSPVFSVDISKRYLTFAVDADVQWCNLWGLCGAPGDLSIWGAVSTTFSCKDTKYALSVS